MTEQVIDRIAIRQAAGIIRSGGIVAFPTETVYGLGADATNNDAITRIFQIKGRPADNPLIAHVHSLAQAKSISLNFPDIAVKLAKSFWPGPLTLVVNKNQTVSSLATAGLSTIAVRMPANMIALELIKTAAVAIVAPSANLSGKPSPTNAAHVLQDIGGKVDMVIDGGDTELGIESTVVDVSTENTAILRLGSISKGQIEDIIGPIEVGGTGTQAPKAPGMKYTHYSPDAKVIIVREPGAIEKIKRLYADYAKAGKRVIIIAFSENSQDLTGLESYSISSAGDPKTYMRKFYGTLRDLDSKTDVILVIDVPEEDAWMAVRDKMLKASDEIH